jgi:hypothetical protein
MSTFSLVCFASAGLIFLFLGTLHLLYTFFTDRFQPYDALVEEGMKKTSPKLTRRTSMWDAWMGFNGSHSTGAMFFGFALIFGAWIMPTLLESPIFLSVVLGNTLFYVWLGVKYWFRIPLTGIVIAAALIAAATAHYLLFSPGTQA